MDSPLGNPETIKPRVVVPGNNGSGMEDLLKQLESEGLTKINHGKSEEKKAAAPLDEANRLLREYDISIVGRTGAKPDVDISYDRIMQKTRVFSRLQGSVDRRLHFEGSPLMSLTERVSFELGLITGRPVSLMTPTDDLFREYFLVAEDLLLTLDSAYAHYQNMMDSVRTYKDERVLKLFIGAISERKRLEAEIENRNAVFERTGEQLKAVTKSHPEFPILYVAYNNLRRDLKGLTNEMEKTCQRIVIKDQDMRIMSEYEERLGNAVALYDRERVYLGDIMEHARETFSVYQFSRELRTGIASISSSVKSLSNMTYVFVERILGSSNEIAQLEDELLNGRIMPRILDGLSRDYGINLAKPSNGASGFAQAAAIVLESRGIA